MRKVDLKQFRTFLKDCSVRVNIRLGVFLSNLIDNALDVVGKVMVVNVAWKLMLFTNVKLTVMSEYCNESLKKVPALKHPRRPRGS